MTAVRWDLIDALGEALDRASGDDEIGWYAEVLTLAFGTPPRPLPHLSVTVWVSNPLLGQPPLLTGSQQPLPVVDAWSLDAFARSLIEAVMTQRSAVLNGPP